MKQLLSAVLCLIGLASTTLAQEPAKPAAAQAAAKFVTTDGYPMDTCVLSGEALDDSAKVFTVNGHTFKTCCKKCQAKLEKDAPSHIAKKEAAVIAAQGPIYALTTCPISGKTLTEKAVAVVADNTLIKLCCGNCKDKLMADPATSVAKVQAAAFAKQTASYASKTCPVSGHDLDENAVSVMHGTTLVKLCCEDCMEKFSANANAMAAKVHGKAEAKPEAKTDAKTEGKGSDGKSGHQAPMAAAGAGKDGAAACCTTEKPAAGCCESGAKAGAGCCESGAAGKDAKAECCKQGATPEKAAAKPAKKAN